MRIALLGALCAFFTAGLFGQAGTGTITGTITDSAGAVVPGAAVEVRSAETNVAYPTVSTDTGVYTVLRLPPGPYSVIVTVTGFKSLTRAGLSVSAGQTLPLDLVLEVGAVSESVTVTAEATLLKTESGDVAHNVTLSQLNNLPILGIGGNNAGSNGIRNPFNSAILVPGISFTPNFAMIVNGAPSNTAAYRIEGLDNTNHTVAFANTQSQPSPDAVEEIAIQTSNYAAEYGQAGGGLFNLTMKSGTNQYHGTVYDYFVNEKLNAGIPFSYTPEGGKFRPRARRWDVGGTFGGPVIIPKLYNGKNKTFFFYSYEYFREYQDLTFTATLPNAMYQSGNFGAISPVGGSAFDATLGVPAASIATDGLGRSVFANAIYDPLSRSTTSGGVGIADVFPGNVIPVARFSPVAVAIQKLYPKLSNNALYNNYNGYSPGERVGKIPSIKIDHTINSNNKLSMFYNHTETNAQYTLPNGNADGLPELLTGARGSKPIGGPVWRLNYDLTLTPTLLAHFGAGYSYIYFFDNGPYTNAGNKFDCASIQLQGCLGSFNFPTIITANVATPVRLGGMQQLGNALAHAATHTQRPSANANLTWIKGNHTFKTGAEMWYQGHITGPPTGVGLTFGSNATGLPASIVTGAFSPGFAYASFLLGGVSAATQNAPVNARMHKKQWGMFVQDSWKVTRKLTVDYGLRWDYATAAHEQYGRSSNLGMIPNASVGNRIGAPIFEATCGCDFVSNYPYAVAPRLGFAYQLNAKTVLRGGWGLAYAVPNDINVQNNGNLTNTPTGVNAFAFVNSPGSLPQPVWPNFNPAQTPLAGATTSTFLQSLDRNASRPPRQNQWSFGIQREISKDFVMEASWVANRGAWWTGPLGYLNQVSPSAFAAAGLAPYSNPADNLLLGQALSAAPVIARVGNGRPYAGYAATNTLFNSLRPFPQFTTIGVQNSATGNTWYDSLQVKGTQRLSHGLQVNGVFTWSKSLTTVRPNLFLESQKSHQSTDQPFVFNVNILYTTQKWFDNKVLATVTKDWNFGAFLQYSSGLLLTPPAATNTNFIGGSEQYRVAGEPLYTKDLNCGCINPYTDLVLNPKAWANPVNGSFGPATGTFYSDFRAARRPSESLNFGRTFRIKEGVNFSLRAEFVNIFNRLQIGNPSTTAPATAVSKNAQGQYSGGFGTINLTVSGPNTAPTGTSNNNVGQLFSQPRSGTLVGRISF